MSSSQQMTDAEIERRMAQAAQAAEEGQHRTAARLYDQLGKDIQTRCGRYDSRALDVFEGLARVIDKAGKGGGKWQ